MQPVKDAHELRARNCAVFVQSIQQALFARPAKRRILRAARPGDDGEDYELVDD